ncbi:MAG: hypothetical protein J6P41_04940 [Prevotella sp.]|nr:hypothetical protein [Prevotella sp.]
MKTTDSGKRFDRIVTILVLLILAGIVGWLIAGDITGMREATTNFEYYENFVYLIDNIGRSYFFCCYMVMVYLTYIQKQYSKWCITLFNVLGVSVLLYFVIAGNFYSYFFKLVEPEYMDKMPSVTRTLFTGPIFFMIIGYFFVPKILKDANKLKEEQELTV